MDVDPNQTQSFETPEAFWAWLAAHHDRAQVLWVKLYKRQAGIASITWEQAVIAALAWGWIDGIKKSNDDRSWFQRFTPRKPKSGWSRKNREHAEALIAEGRMQAPGLAHVETARADGRWEAAYAGSSALEIPQDFLAAIAGNPAAQKTFEVLNRANLFSIYHWLHTAKKPETRQSRMEKIIGMLERGEKFH